MSERGGARPGAGRKKGVQNKVNAEARAKAVAGGVLPLEYMLKVMRDPKAQPGRRDEMARAAAPYVHPRLQVTQVSGDPLQPVIFQMINRPPKEQR